MRNSFLLLAFSVSFVFSYGQDVIVQQNGNEIEAKVLEIAEQTIKYKEYDFQEGPTRNISISDVFMIIYANGRREVFKTRETIKEELPTNTNISYDDIYENRRTRTVQQSNQYSTTNTSKIMKEYEGNYYDIGIGVGVSYGGLGVKAQRRWGDVLGFGFTSGIGYLTSTDEIGWALGPKFYFYKDFSLTANFGTTSVQPDYYGEWESEIGIAFLIGGDWTWGESVKYGFNINLGVAVHPDAYYTTVPALDIGFIIRY